VRGKNVLASRLAASARGVCGLKAALMKRFELSSSSMSCSKTGMTWMFCAFTLYPTGTTASRLAKSVKGILLSFSDRAGGNSDVLDSWRLEPFM